jgi:predicted HNH restriction endonuclease
MYNCNFPKCNYSTDHRHQIHNHHIVSKASGGNDNKVNLIMVCPNCHSNIFQADAKSGIHSIKGKSSIELIRKISSTAGLLLEYKDPSGETDYTVIKM